VQTILIANPKGGSGKTTLATNIAGWLAGSWDRDAMVAMGQQATRNYAKRQFTWMRNQPPPDWQRIEAKDYDVASIFASLLRD